MGSGADGDFHETTLEREARELRESRRSLKLGGTYKHYKTKGLYKVLQLVKLLCTSDEPLDCYTQVIRKVKYTGDGPLDGQMMELCYALNGGMLFVRYVGAATGILVLYRSYTAKDFFVRPLHEFVATVEDRPDPENPRVVRNIPRFEFHHG